MDMVLIPLSGVTTQEDCAMLEANVIANSIVLGVSCT